MRRYLVKHQDSFVLLLGGIAVIALAFEAGIIQGSSRIKPPLRVELAPEAVVSELSRSALVESDPKKSTLSSIEEKAIERSGECAFVASRNSKLYHAASCGVVKRIKPVNRLCFKNADEALKRGLTLGCEK